MLLFNAFLKKVHSFFKWKLYLKHFHCPVKVECNLEILEHWLDENALGQLEYVESILALHLAGYKIALCKAFYF